MMRTVLSLLGMLATGYVGVCALLYFTQRSMIYYPVPRSCGGSSELMVLQVEGARVQVSARPSSGNRALIYFGGNAEDVSCMLPDLAQGFAEHALYLMHYRGYGGSTGSPSESALHADALALFDKVQREHREVVVIGRSLGSGVAVYLASQRPVARLVLVTPYDSMVGVAAHHYPWMPVRWLLRDKFESWRYAAQVTAPTLLLMAEHDEIIPRASTEALHTRFRSGTATLKVLTGVDHNSIGASSEYLPSLIGATS